MLASDLSIKLFIRRILNDSCMFEDTEAVNTFTNDIEIGEYITTWHYSPGGIWHEYRNGEVRYIVSAKILFI